MKCFSGMVWTEFYMQKITIHKRYCNECQSLFKVDIGYTKGPAKARGDTDQEEKELFFKKEGRMLLKEEMKKGNEKDGSVDGFMKKRVPEDASKLSSAK